MTDHGYVRYTRGCRCEVCRAAKADYMRARRAGARQMAARHTISGMGGRPSRHSAWSPGSTRYVAPIERHGTRYGYEEAGCRCYACTVARRESDRKYTGRAS